MKKTIKYVIACIIMFVSICYNIGVFFQYNDRPYYVFIAKSAPSLILIAVAYSYIAIKLLDKH